LRIFKRTLDGFLVVLFLLCIFLALSAALDTMTVATERPYLLQGTILFGSVAIIAAAAGLMLGLNAMKRRIGDTAAGWISWIWFGLVFIAGVYVRVRVIRAIPITPSSDFATYYKLGELLADGELLSAASQQLREYVSMFPHTIGFPLLLLKPAFAVFGTSVTTALYANLVCSMISVLLMYGIGQKIAGRRAGLAAMTLMSLWPSHVLYSSMVASDPAFTCLLLGGLYLVAAGVSRGPKSLYENRPIAAIVALLGAGLAIGIANAIRPMAVILLIAVVLCLLLDSRFRRASVEQGGPRQILSIRWLCLVLVLLPFLLTNIILSQTVEKTIALKPTGGIAASGYNLLVGTNVESNGIWNQENADFFNDAYLRTGSAQEAQEACLDRAIELMRSRPEDVLNLMVFKFRDMWGSDDFGIDWNLLWMEQQGLLTDDNSAQLQALRPIGRILYFCLLLLAGIAGIRQLMRRNVGLVFRISMLFFLGTAALHMVLETQIRYHYTALAFLMLMAVSALMRRDWETIAPVEGTAAILQPGDPKAADSRKATQADMPDVARAIREGHIVITATRKSSQDFIDADTREKP